MNTSSERGGADCVPSVGCKVAGALPTHNESNADATTLRLVVESVPNALVLIDARGIITMANTLADGLFGYGHGELLGQAAEMLVPERCRTYRAGQKAGFFRYLDIRAREASRDIYGLRKDGSEIPIEIDLIPIPIQTAQGAGVLAAIVDISEQLRHPGGLAGLF